MRLGPDNDNSGECTNFCTTAACGDGFVQEGEECDDGDKNMDGGCDPETCQKPVTTCGDGMLQDYEECDESAGGDLAKVCTNCFVDSRVVFATSAAFGGNFAGIDGADAICATAAAAAKVGGEGTSFIAWLSAPGSTIESRMSKLPYKYIRVDEAVIADGWQDLSDGKLQHPIDVDEFGNDAMVTYIYAWTGSLADGTAATTNCSACYSNAPGVAGTVGLVNASDSKWSFFADAVQCSQKAHLYCIEQ